MSRARRKTPRVHRSEVEILAHDCRAAELCEVLKNMRQSRGLSHAAAGRLIGVSAKRVARIEQRPGNTRFDLFARYIEAIGGSLHLSKVTHLIEASVNANLRSARGRLDARKVADVFGLPYAEFAKLIGMNPQTMLKTTDSANLQPKLRDFDRIARLRTLGKVTPAFFRKWLNTEIESLRGNSPIDWIRNGKVEIVANLVDNLVTSQPS